MAFYVLAVFDSGTDDQPCELLKNKQIKHRFTAKTKHVLSFQNGFNACYFTYCFEKRFTV